MRRLGHTPPSPIGVVPASPGASTRNKDHLTGRFLNRSNISAQTQRDPRQMLYGEMTEWHWNAHKEVMVPLETVASLYGARLSEGFTVCHCDLSISSNATEDGELETWGLILQMQAVWEPLRLGIEWTVRAEGQLATDLEGRWRATSKDVQRLLLLNRLLHEQSDEPGWLSELEVPFEAGITRINGVLVPVDILRLESLHANVAFRLWTTR